MKILFTFYNPSGGMETLNRIRCEALQEQGVECHLLYKIDGNGKKNIKNIKTFIFNDDAELQALLQREQYDVIVVCTDSYLMESIRALGYKGSLIYEVQGLGTPETAKEIITRFEASIREHATAILYPQTKHLKELMEAHLADLPQFCFDDPLPVGKFGYESYPAYHAPIMAWVGRIEANKNWREYLELGHRLSAQYPTLQLWMFEDQSLFDPQEKAAFDQFVAMLGLEPRLYRYDCVPHDLMADYYSIVGDSGGFLASTSILEGFGYAVAEALLCRCPVLSTDSDGIRRFIVHNETGKIYPRGNLLAAIDEAVDLMRNVPVRESIRTAGMARIRNHFSPEQYTKSFMGMIRKLHNDGNRNRIMKHGQSIVSRVLRSRSGASQQ
ncbi:glycosyltransferase involved in cell wall biosynthesis [Paenibacillus phyllosphaerae]|uniref:Glycosyltransferase involved in cell wall biosynthesis n=1 Tax=Paenibacillus phyllosphaerae TaxID=274593 RepID=A0A7W5AX13_9BACL|nr:glycosyltransferase family 4 protein [Paenibacillus phyllosphaerae]MBB3110242.1 glycosyltransferase involved in cell wall biosynthesis [Paenibacillus phyllosphaerae]